MAFITGQVELPEQFKCPICDEIPSEEIYQCENGHTFCDTCDLSIGNLCPQCRVSLGSKRIRNLALEGLLDGMDLNLECPFKELGCTEVVERKQMGDHKENCQFGTNVQPPNEIEWVAKKNGKVPRHAFIAGVDSDKPVYVIRAPHSRYYGGEGGCVPGNLKLGNKYGYITYGGDQLAKSNYQVLTCPEGMLTWVTSSNGRLHENAVEGGADPSGDTYYIARVVINGVSLVGKIHPRYNLAYIPQDGREVEYSEYEILVKNNEFQ